MAKITEGSIISEIRGSVGLQTYSKNKAGAYVKAKINQTVTSTLYQLTYRDYMSQCVAGWKTLTDAERLEWASWAQLEPSHHNLPGTSTKAGFNFFLKVNIMRCWWNGAFSNYPYERDPQQCPYSMTFDDFNENEMHYTVKSTLETNNWIIRVKASPQVSPGIMSINPRRLSYINFILYPFVGTFSDTLTGAWSTRWGVYPFTPGMAVFLQPVFLNTLTAQQFVGGTVKKIIRDI